MATAGKKKILIALQKPTLVLGNADPMDTIHRTISRGYAVGPARGRWIVGGVLGSCLAGVAAWWTATQIWSVTPRTMNSEWKEATEDYIHKQGTAAIITSHEIGQPVPAIPKPSERISQ
eukprot:TRINITY_DN6966_c0_g1_i1.p1 TRINITY_DN6966_c0_g1~~TRINITY_DN6966_c0_g1_i1.p1  ORF type:complete len:119 (+),score=30.35 TRINITY_DN6966_c0_g1_i1:154-510(+)